MLDFRDLIDLTRTICAVLTAVQAASAVPVVPKRPRKPRSRSAGSFVLVKEPSVPLWGFRPVTTGSNPGSDLDLDRLSLSLKYPASEAQIDIMRDKTHL